MRGQDTKRRRAIAALLAAPTIRAAATRCGVNERQLHRWLADEGFRIELDQASKDALGRATRQIRAASADAVRCLRRAIRDKERPALGVQAARTVLDHVRSTALEDLETRIAALEAAAKDK